MRQPRPLFVLLLIAGVCALVLVTLIASDQWRSPPRRTVAAPWQGSFDSSYQAAPPGSVITVPAGTYGSQVIAQKQSARGGGCALDNVPACVTFVMGGPVKINGVLEIRGSGILVDGGRQLDVSGYTDTETGGSPAATSPDHVVVENLHTTSFGVFNTDTVTFKNLDVGPAYVATGTAGNYRCGIEQGNGFENKIGQGGNNTNPNRSIVLDGLYIHDQNSRNQAARETADCHYGGMILQTADGLTIKNSVFERNVVYHVEVQNFGGAPQAKNVLFENNSFSCPVDWAYFGDRCDGQRAIQFDYDPGAQFELKDNVSANGKSSNGESGLYGCYNGACGNFAGLKVSGTVDQPDSTTAPPLLNGPGPPLPPTDTLPLTLVAQTATTVTLGWTPPLGAVAYRFFVNGVAKSNTWDASRSQVKFGKVADATYRVDAALTGPFGTIRLP